MPCCEAPRPAASPGEQGPMLPNLLPAWSWDCAGGTKEKGDLCVEQVRWCIQMTHLVGWACTGGTQAVSSQQHICGTYQVEGT